MSDNGRVNMEIEISDEQFLALAKEAHKLDITFNNLFNKILREKIEIEEKKEIEELKEI
jgi:hypothetical protein